MIGYGIVPRFPAAMLDTNQLHAQAERIRASGVLGRSRLTRRLFDFLVDCSLTGRAPKEIEVAIDVFGKGAEFDVSQDAMVRVYIHKLRRKLEEFYAGPGRAESERLVIPKGDYRFVIEASAHAVLDDPPQRRGRWVRAALGASVIANVIALAAFGYAHWRASPGGLARLRESAVWSPLIDNGRTIFVVLGDYYIFGDTGRTGRSNRVERLIRQFSINSPADLDQYLMLHPARASRYLDLQLNYLPTAVGYALRDVMPLLARAHARVRVALASQLNPAVLTSANVVYIGYLSGMGMLHDLVFAGSRFSAGSSADELVDRVTGRHYASEATMPHGEEKYHDYGYFATLSGPAGNRIVVISGMGDAAVMHTAEAVTRLAPLERLEASTRGAKSYESLYDVYGMDRMNLGGKRLLTAKLNTGRIWTGEPQDAVAVAAIKGRGAAPVGAAQRTAGAAR